LYGDSKNSKILFYYKLNYLNDFTSIKNYFLKNKLHKLF